MFNANVVHYDSVGDMGSGENKAKEQNVCDSSAATKKDDKNLVDKIKEVFAGNNGELSKLSSEFQSLIKERDILLQEHDNLQKAHAELQKNNKSLEDNLNALKTKAEKYKEGIILMEGRHQRAVKEIDAMQKTHVDRKKLAKDLIEFYEDGPRRAMEFAQNDDSTDQEGLKMFFDSCDAILNKYRIARFAPNVGDIFDYSLHNAISIVKDPNAKDGVVVNVVRGGYMLDDELLMHAMVIVNENKSASDKKDAMPKNDDIENDDKTSSSSKSSNKV